MVGFHKKSSPELSKSPQEVDICLLIDANHHTVGVGFLSQPALVLQFSYSLHGFFPDQVLVLWLVQKKEGVQANLV